MTELRRTPLYPAHVRAGAKLVDFAGFEMPVQYTSILEEHRAVRERAGLFDVSHMGEIVLAGPGALRAVQRLVTNDLAAAADGQAMYAAVCNERGGIVDDVVVYRRAGDDFLVCVNASNRAKDFAWFQAQVGELPGLSLRDEGDGWAQLALQGPKAAAILARLTQTELARLGNYRFTQGRIAGRDGLIARTGYTGEDGFELFVPPGDALALWDALLEAGKPEALTPCGLGARDSLRTEMKYCLYGNDIDDDTTPLEAGLGWIVKLGKAERFVGQDALERQKGAGIPRKLVGFTLVDKGIPRHGYPVLLDGRRVSEVRSGTMSPTLKIPIGLCYLPAAQAQVGQSFAVEIRGRAVAAKVVPTPFYRRGG
ncbi:MAG: glycine cleavage system aminomethyltransferase GcvT [Myxococcales bacterium]